MPKGTEFIFTSSRAAALIEGNINDALWWQAPDDHALLEYRNKVGQGVQISLAKLFAKYNLTGKTWAALTKSQEHFDQIKGEVQSYVNEGGIGPIRAARHSIRPSCRRTP